jgi:hypothetical protein
MKIKEPKSMQEIHRIREKHYQQTKGMSLREHLEWIKTRAEESERRQGLKLRKVA